MNVKEVDTMHGLELNRFGLTAFLIFLIAAAVGYGIQAAGSPDSLPT